LKYREDIPGWCKRFLISLHRLDVASYAIGIRASFLGSGWGKKVATNLHLVLTAGMCGAVPPFCSVSSYVTIKQRDRFMCALIYKGGLVPSGIIFVSGLMEMSVGS
jgi:fluoride ion exporter CrcB/FEX